MNHARTPLARHFFSSLLELLDHYTPSMRQLVDIQVLWQSALKLAELRLAEYDRSLAPLIPAECPYTVEDIVSDKFDFDAALRQLRASTGS